jgi:hypothetical protein
MKRAGADDALGVGWTKARVRPGERSHRVDDLRGNSHGMPPAD